MGIAKWAAVAVTVLMGLANLGQLAQDDLGLKILGSALAVAAAIAVGGYALRRSWGATAVIAVGAANLVGCVVAIIAGSDGWPVSLVLSALAIVLTAVAQPHLRREVVA